MDPHVHSRFRRAAIAGLAAIILMAAIFSLLTIFPMAAILSPATAGARKDTAGTEQGDNAY